MLTTCGVLLTELSLARTVVQSQIPPLVPLSNNPPAPTYALQHNRITASQWANPTTNFEISIFISEWNVPQFGQGFDQIPHVHWCQDENLICEDLQKSSICAYFLIDIPTSIHWYDHGWDTAYSLTSLPRYHLKAFLPLIVCHHTIASLY